MILRLLILLALTAVVQAQTIVQGPKMPLIASYVAGTAVFDGTNDLMRMTVSNPPGLADGKQFTFSAWIQMGADDANCGIFILGALNSTRVIISRPTNNWVRVFGRNAAISTILDLHTTNTLKVADGWVHLFVCIDLTDAAKRKVYLNGSPSSLVVTTYTNDTLDMQGVSYLYNVGCGTASPTPDVRLNGALSEVWFDDSYLDDPTKFASGGHPISLGANGSIPTGSSPAFYFRGSGNGFNVNSGTAGDMTITGSLGTTTPP